VLTLVCRSLNSINAVNRKKQAKVMLQRSSSLLQALVRRAE